VRVLRVIARLNVGGPALHVTYLTAGLDRRGYSTTLVAGRIPPGEDSMEDVTARHGVRVVRLGSMSREISPLADLRSVVQLVRLIRRERPSILHTHTAKAGTVGRVAAVLAGRARPPVVVHTFHGHVLRGYFSPARERFFRSLERLLARVTTRLVAVSPEVRDELVAFGIAPRERFAVVRLGIDLDERLGGAAPAPELPAAAFVVGWAGRMTAIKRVGDAVDALARLRARGVDALLVLVGDGPGRAVAESRAGELGVSTHVFLPGAVGDVAPWYRAFDAFLLPSANEGTPVVAIESLAAGTPVVATRVGGVADVVRDGVDGLLVAPGDVDAMADALERLARDAELRERMGAAGRERGRKRYAVERLIDDVDRLYRELLAEKGLAPPTA
jgi:glycosyltransferase involved in cell wall biosynthesis